MVDNKGIARETIFLIVLGLVTVFIIIYVLWQVLPQQSGWTPQCNAQKYAYCAEWSSAGWDPAFTKWTEYAPQCPKNGPIKILCEALLRTGTTAAS